MEKEQIKMWMPVMKTASGGFLGILSDSSIDRDGEFMTKELLKEWAQTANVKALANHENKMEKWVGGWRNLKVVEKGEQAALIGEPWFFSKEANPLAQQIKMQVEEALANGENAGISIGALPKESVQKEIDGKEHKAYTKAELLEGTWVPIQSNRNAMSFARMVKSFNLDNNMEDKTMVAEIKKDEVASEPEAAPAEEAPKEPEAPKEEAKEEPEAPKEEKPKEAETQIAILTKQVEKLTKELTDLKTKSVNLPTVEKAEVKEKKIEPTFANLLKARYGVVEE